MKNVKRLFIHSKTKLIVFLGLFFLAMLAGYLYIPNAATAVASSDAPGKVGQDSSHSKSAEANKLNLTGAVLGTESISLDATKIKPNGKEVVFCNTDANEKIPQTYTNEMLTAAINASSEKLSASLAQTGRQQDTALALYLSAKRHAEQARSNYLNSHLGCENDKNCTALASAEAVSAKEDDAIALSRLATTTDDANIYALAHALCARYKGTQLSGACSQINLEKWQRLAPDQIEPLIALTRRAANKNDTTELYLALQRVANFPGKFTSQTPVFPVFETNSFKSLSPTEQHLMQLEIMADSPHDFIAFSASEYCAENQLADANRYQLCNALAEKMTQSSDSILDHMTGIALAKKLAWPRDKISQLTQNANRIRKTLKGQFEFVSANTCAGFQKMGDLPFRILEQGEMTVARKQLQSTTP